MNHKLSECVYGCRCKLVLLHREWLSSPFLSCSATFYAAFSHTACLYSTDEYHCMYMYLAGVRGHGYIYINTSKSVLSSLYWNLHHVTALSLHSPVGHLYKDGWLSARAASSQSAGFWHCGYWGNLSLSLWSYCDYHYLVGVQVSIQYHDSDLSFSQQ